MSFVKRNQSLRRSMNTLTDTGRRSQDEVRGHGVLIDAIDKPVLPKSLARSGGAHLVFGPAEKQDTGDKT